MKNNASTLGKKIVVVALSVVFNGPLESNTVETPLPTTEDFNGALSTCATGADINVNADLIGSIASIYRGQRTNGAASFRTATKFLELFPEADRTNVYELYTKCILQNSAYQLPRYYKHWVDQFSSSNTQD